MGMVMTISSMRVDHGDVATLKRFAPDLAKEIIHALDAASHQRAQQDCGVLVEGRAEHGRYREDDVAIDDAFVEHLADLAHTG